jgi:Entner-Doudoroff aldolase
MVNYNNILKEIGIIPVIAIENEEHAVPMAEALIKGGLNAAEITFRTDAASASIKRISDAFPDMFVCAGTVLSVKQALLAMESGAKAIISPGTNISLVKWCIDNNIPIYPGCATPTEVETSTSVMGLETVKLFPAEVVGGIGMLKALYGPYKNVKFMPTGGISPQNVAEYLSLPNVIACGGSWICSTDLLNAGDFKTIENNAKDAAEIVKSLR